MRAGSVKPHLVVVRRVTLDRRTARTRWREERYVYGRDDATPAQPEADPDR